MTALAIFAIFSVATVCVATDPDVLEHESVLASRNGVRLLMYHAGYAARPRTKDDFRNYLQTYVDFVKEKHIDKVMLSIQDPGSVKILQNEDVLVEFMRSLPSYVELGALLEIDPQYPWHYDVIVAGGYNPFSKVFYGGQPTGGPPTELPPTRSPPTEPPPTTSPPIESSTTMSQPTETPATEPPSTSSPPEPSRAAIIKRILSPGPDHCKPRTISEAELFCPGNYKIDARWKAVCPGDPCVVVSAPSYCQGPLVCHGFPPLPPVFLAESVSQSESSNTCPYTNPPPPGCPNNIPKAINFLADLNKKAQVPGNPNGARMFTFAGYDSEDAGGYKHSALVNFFVQMIGNGSIDFLSSIPDGYSIPSAGLGPAYKEEDKAKMIRFGDAGGPTKNPKVEVAAIDCNSFIPADDKASLFLCAIAKSAILPYVETYPELYWFENEIRGVGCIGCPIGKVQIFTEDSNYWEHEQIGSINQCSACFQPESCKKYVQYYSDYSPSTYPQCMNDPECVPCCRCLGCLSCAFDSTGNMYGPQNPNSRLVYQKFRNQPAALADNLAAGFSPARGKILAMPNVWPMFSIETSHNWKVSEGGYEYDAAFGAHTCLTRSFSGENCGIFDGLGDWEWDKFLEMATTFASKYGIKNIGIYELQFLPAHWFKSGQFSHTGPNDGSLYANGASKECPSSSIISAINAKQDSKYIIDSYAKADSLYYGHKGSYAVCPGLTIGDPCRHVNPVTWFDQSSGLCYRL